MINEETLEDTPTWEFTTRARLAVENAQLRAEVQHLTEENKRLNEENFWCGGDRVELEAERDEARAQRDDFQQAGREWRDAALEAEAERDALAEELEDLRKTREAITPEMIELQERVNWMVARADAMTNALSEVSQEVDGIVEGDLPYIENEMHSARDHLQDQINDLAGTVGEHAKKLDTPITTCKESTEKFTRSRLTIHALNIAPVGSRAVSPSGSAYVEKTPDGSWLGIPARRIVEWEGWTLHHPEGGPQ